VFVAVYQKTLSLMYVDELLALVRDAFTDGYSPSSYNYEAFGSKFNKILRDCEARADAARRNAAVQQVMTEVGEIGGGVAWRVSSLMVLPMGKAGKKQEGTRGGGLTLFAIACG
jgi:hypothetical protein